MSAIRFLNINVAISTLAVVGLALFILRNSSFADPTLDEVKVTIQKQVHTADTAIDNFDANGAVAYFAPNYVGYDSKGKVVVPSKAVGLAGLKALFQKAKQITSVTTITSLRFVGDKAETQSSGTLTIQIQDPNTGKIAVLTEQGVTTDVWDKNSSGVWLDEKSTQVSSGAVPTS